jgi:two-component system sensor histidine kinase/response regulator
MDVSTSRGVLRCDCCSFCSAGCKPLEHLSIAAKVRTEFKMHTILIIDDDTDLSAVLGYHLRSEGFQVLQASDGTDGLRMAEASHPDLILCDIDMPGIGGYEVLRILRGQPPTADIPLIFLTGRTGPRDVRSGMTMGAEDYLCKPVSAADLLTALRSQIEKQEKQKHREEARVEGWAAQLGNTLAHELRTPLCAITPIADLMESCIESNDMDHARSYNHCLKEGAQRLHKTVERVILYQQLMLLRAQGGCQLVDVDAPYGDRMARYANRVAKRWSREQDLRLKICEANVVLYSKHLEWLVEEVVENAFKFSESGTPVVLEFGQEEDALNLRVEDQGRGMSTDQLKSVSVFRQFDRKTYEQQGLGLGLELIRRLAELYQGKVRIHSVPARGTVVLVHIPIIRSAS